jgi:GTP cyclohydrolase I
VRQLRLVRHDDDVPTRLTARTRRLADRFRAFMAELGVDLSDPDLGDTPMRVARAYEEMLSAPDPRIRTFANIERSAQLVTLSDIPFYSICAHHFLPFFGTVDIAYVPDERLLGLSKLPRIVDAYARRPQMQERMTDQVMTAIVEALHPRGARVVVRARHLCLEMRGANKAGLVTTTRATYGEISPA